MTHADEQALEQDARNALYRAVAQFVMEPNSTNVQLVETYANNYRNAWMRGRRRVMD
jgi:pyoverdine/dityrosine biosynthesis protein Dit1